MSSRRGLSANRLALDLVVPSGRITDMLSDLRSISADTALRLGRYFLLLEQFEHPGEARMTADRIEIRIVLHPLLRLAAGTWEKP